MAFVTPTDRPKSVRNRCLIDVFGGICVLSRFFLCLTVSVGAFVIGLSLFLFTGTLIETNVSFLQCQLSYTQFSVSLYTGL